MRALAAAAVAVLIAGSAAAQEVTPLAEPDCTAVRRVVEDGLDMLVGFRYRPDAAMQPFAGNAPSGRACQMTALFTGLSHKPDEDFLPEERIREALAADGWQEDQASLVYLAEGCGSGAFALRKGAAFCMVRWSVDAIEEHDACGADGPPPKPWELAYDLKLDCFTPR